nr:hypothetical protein [Tanacetum cinerariifolium]
MRRHGKDFSRRVTPVFETMLIQHPAEVGKDETVHKEKGDRVERAATTIASLDAEQDKASQEVGKKRKSRTLQLKRRLFKVRIESSAEKSLGDQEDASNKGRNDQDERISFVYDAEIQERYDHDIEINTTSTSITIASINITTAEPVTTVSTPITNTGVSVSTAEPSTPATITTTVIEDEDLIICNTPKLARSRILGSGRATSWINNTR